MNTDRNNLTAYTPKTEAGIVYPMLCECVGLLCGWLVSIFFFLFFVGGFFSKIINN